MNDDVFGVAVVFIVIGALVGCFFWGKTVAYDEYRETKPCVDFAVWEYDQKKVPVRCLEARRG